MNQTTKICPVHGSGTKVHYKLTIIVLPTFKAIYGVMIVPGQSRKWVKREFKSI